MTNAKLKVNVNNNVQEYELKQTAPGKPPVFNDIPAGQWTINTLIMGQPSHWTSLRPVSANAPTFSSSGKGLINADVTSNGDWILVWNGSGEQSKANPELGGRQEAYIRSSQVVVSKPPQPGGKVLSSLPAVIVGGNVNDPSPEFIASTLAKLNVKTIRDYQSIKLVDPPAERFWPGDKMRWRQRLSNLGIDFIVTISCPLNGQPDFGWPHKNWDGLAQKIESLVDKRHIIQLINEPEHSWKENNQTRWYWPGGNWRDANLAAILLARAIKKINPDRRLGTPSPTTKSAGWLQTFGQHLKDNGAVGLFEFFDAHWYSDNIGYLKSGIAAHKSVAASLGMKSLSSEFGVSGSAKLENRPLSTFTSIIETVMSELDVACFWTGIQGPPGARYTDHACLADRNGNLTQLGTEWNRLFAVK